MIYQNVPAGLFEALKRSGCIMYMNGDNRIESVSLMKILSVYGDRIVVYNFDKSLRVRFLATNLVLFISSQFHFPFLKSLWKRLRLEVWTL